MKRSITILSLLMMAAVTAAGAPALAEPTDLGESGAGSCQEELDLARQEIQKNKDLVGIWKGHVKTLTKERDAANRELESLRGASAPPAAGSVEAGMVDDLKYQLNQLRAENQELKANMNRLQSQPARAPQAAPMDDARIAELQRQINDSQRNQQQMAQDRSKLAAEIADLKNRLRAAEANANAPVDEEAPDSAAAEEEIRELKAQIVALRDANADLSRRAAQAESRRLAPPAAADDSARVRELEAQVERLREQNERLSRTPLAAPSYAMGPSLADPDTQKLMRDKAEAERAYAQLESESRNETQKLKTLIFTLQAENKKIDVLREELRKSQAEADASRQAYADMERNLRTEIDRANGKIAQLKGEADRLRGYESELQAASEYKQQAEAAYRALEDNHQSEVQRLANRITSLQADSEQLNVVRGELKRTQDQKAALEQNVAQLLSTQAKLERRIQEQEGQIDMHTREIQQVRSSIESQLEALSQKTVRRT